MITSKKSYVPILVAVDGEVRIVGRRVRNVAHKGEHLLEMVISPLGVERCQHGCRIDVVAIMEVVVVVPRIAKVHTDVGHGRAAVRRSAVCAMWAALALAVIVGAPEIRSDQIGSDEI